MWLMWATNAALSIDRSMLYINSHESHLFINACFCSIYMDWQFSSPWKKENYLLNQPRDLNHEVLEGILNDSLVHLG